METTEKDSVRDQTRRAYEEAEKIAAEIAVSLKIPFEAPGLQARLRQKLMSFRQDFPVSFPCAQCALGENLRVRMEELVQAGKRVNEHAAHAFVSGDDERAKALRSAAQEIFTKADELRAWGNRVAGSEEGHTCQS